MTNPFLEQWANLINSDILKSKEDVIPSETLNALTRAYSSLQFDAWIQTMQVLRIQGAKAIQDNDIEKCRIFAVVMQTLADIDREALELKKIELAVLEELEE